MISYIMSWNNIPNSQGKIYESIAEIRTPIHEVCHHPVANTLPLFVLPARLFPCEQLWSQILATVKADVTRWEFVPAERGVKAK